MAIDSHSKNVCLIGILHFAAYPIIALANINNALRELEYFRTYPERSSLYTYVNLGLIPYCIVMTILSFLMIQGAVKKISILLAPFLVISSLVLGVSIIGYVMDYMNYFVNGYFYYRLSAYRIGFEILSVYPVYTLYIKLRSQNKKEKSLSLESEKKPVMS